MGRLAFVQRIGDDFWRRIVLPGLVVAIPPAQNEPRLSYRGPVSLVHCASTSGCIPIGPFSGSGIRSHVQLVSRWRDRRMGSSALTEHLAKSGLRNDLECHHDCMGRTMKSIYNMTVQTKPVYNMSLMRSEDG